MRAHGERDALESLLRTYWSPIYATIRRKGYTQHDASDLTQEFMTKVVLGRDLLSKACPQRGRFRSFIKASLHNFLIDQHRSGHFSLKSARPSSSEAASRNSEARAIDLVPSLEPTGDEELAREFDKRWAEALVNITLQRLREQCELDGMKDHWDAFDACVIGPSYRKQTPPSLDDLAQRLSKPGRGASYDAAQVSNMIQTLKRRFRKVLRDVVCETVDSPEQVEEELEELRRLARG